MKASGIVRKLDPLGRIVIPKEIRKVLGIDEGDSMERIKVDNGGVVKNILKDAFFVEVIKMLLNLMEQLFAMDAERL